MANEWRLTLRVVTNRRLVRNRARFGRLATLGGFAALIGGLAYSTFSIGAQDSQAILFSYVALIAGYVLISVGKTSWLRFSIHPRPDEALAINLKTLDVRTLLFNYVSALPVDHLLATAGGLVVVETRPFVGDIVVRGDRWSRRRGIWGWLQFLSEGALGNPTKDALRGVDQMRQWLTQRLGPEIAATIPIHPMVLFTHPRVALTIEEPTIPVAHVRDARAEVRRVTSGTRVPSDVQRRIEALLLDEARVDGEPVNAGDAAERRTKRRVSRTSRAR